jgi:hypothetical protein
MTALRLGWWKRGRAWLGIGAVVLVAADGFAWLPGVPARTGDFSFAPPQRGAAKVNKSFAAVPGQSADRL